jgi:hypothetical protein
MGANTSLTERRRGVSQDRHRTAGDLTFVIEGEEVGANLSAASTNSEGTAMASSFRQRPASLKLPALTYALQGISS